MNENKNTSVITKWNFVFRRALIRTCLKCGEVLAYKLCPLWAEFEQQIAKLCQSACQGSMLLKQLWETMLVDEHFKSHRKSYKKVLIAGKVFFFYFYFEFWITSGVTPCYICGVWEVYVVMWCLSDYMGYQESNSGCLMQDK